MYLKTFYKWHVLSNFAVGLPDQFNKESFHFFNTVMYGVKEQRPREERAIMSVNYRLGMPLGKTLCSKIFSRRPPRKKSRK